MAIQEPPAVAPDLKARVLRIRVVDNSKDGHPIVNVRMPLRLVKWGMKMGKAFSPQLKDVDIDWDEITTMLESTDLGKIVEVEDEVEHKNVEVWVE